MTLNTGRGIFRVNKIELYFPVFTLYNFILDRIATLVYKEYTVNQGTW